MEYRVRTGPRPCLNLGRSISSENCGRRLKSPYHKRNNSRLGLAGRRATLRSKLETPQFGDLESLGREAALRKARPLRTH